MTKYTAKILSCFMMAFLLLFCSEPQAADNTAPIQAEEENEDTAAFVEIDFSAINNHLGTIKSELNNKNISPQTIDEQVAFLTATENKIISNKKALDKHIKFIQKQLAALGKEPEEGTAEDEVITAQRNALTQELTALDKITKESDLLLVQMEDLTAQVLNTRNQKIYGELITKQSAIINPLVFFEGLKGYAVFFWNVSKSPLEWYKSLPPEEQSVAISSIFLMCAILFVALILSILLRRFILKNWGYKAEIKFPHFNQKVIAAIAVAVSRGVIYAFLIGGCLLWMKSTQIFAGSFLETVLKTTAIISLFAIAEATISRVTFAPNYPQWRLINISSDKASRFTRMIFLFIIINAITALQVILVQKGGYSVQTIHFVMTINCAVKAFFLMWFAKILFDTYKDGIRNESTNSSAENDETMLDRGFRMTLASYLLCAGIFAASLFGYPELSMFILTRLIITMILAGVLEVVRRSIIDIIKRLVFVGPWMKGFRNRKRIIAKMELWLKIFINPVFILIFIFMLLNLWGLPGDFILQVAKKLLFGIKIGGIEISLVAIAMSIFIFFASLTLVRIFKNRVAANLLEKVDMDDGVKHSLISGISFIGFIIATLLAIISLGIDLTNLAFIAGALSVGIGFGLQDVIKNLVAGIIILLERPFKVGDWVMLNGTEGTIKQINIRTTELLSFNKTSIIIPNATLISSSVTNMTHGDAMSRQSIAVGVSYGSNPEQVRDILLDCASKNKKVMKNPAPYVIFKDFGDSSLDFELRFYVNDIWKGWTAPSDLRYEIFKRFHEEGIEIPFPQIVVNQPSDEQ